jgi:pterin-4a-carbinolamine dehydratase
MNLSSLMREYLNESTQDDIQHALFGKIDNQLPAQVEKKPSWDTLENPPRLKRAFELEDSKRVMQFLNEILQYENEISHNASILIKGHEVVIEVYTHSVEDITELDVEYAKEVSNIYRDIKDYDRER